MMIFTTRTMIITLMRKLYDNLLRRNNQPLQLIYLMVMMIMVKMTATMSENVTKYEEKKKVFFQNTVNVVVLKYTSHGCSAHPRAISNKDNTKIGL